MESVLSYLSHQDAQLGSLFAQVGPLDWSNLCKPLYVALVAAVIGQKIKYTQAKAIRAKLYRQLGTNFLPGDYNRLTSEQKIEIGLTATQQTIIARVNQQNLNWAQLTPNQVYPALQTLQAQVDGIGEWTVATTLLTYHPFVDIFPTHDVFLLNRLQKLYALPTRPTPAQAAHMSLAWQPYRGLVTWYLWRWF